MTRVYRFLNATIDVIVLIVEVALGLRLILKLFGANPQAGFVAWVYETTLPLLAPFMGAFPSPTIEGGFVLEFTTLFAMIIYALVAYLIQELLWHVHHASKREK